MSEKVNLDKLGKNARRSFNEDGLVYLFMGVLLLIVGTSFLNNRMLVFAGLAIFLAYPMKRLRERITYPRIGYVEFTMPEGTGKGMLIFMGLVIVVLLAAVFVFSGQLQFLLPLIIGVVFGLSYYFGVSMIGLRLRDVVVIILMVASGALTLLWVEDWRMATAIQVWFVGGLLILMGTIDLIRFLRKYPLSDSVEPAGGDFEGEAQNG